MTKTQTIIEQTERYSAHNYKPLPVVITAAEGVWMTDIEGRRYLDCLSAYSAVSHGHGHPRLLRVMHEQIDRLVVTSRAFHNDQLGPWAQELCELCEMEMALPMNTGAEAVETAIKIARKWGYLVKGVPKYDAKIIACRENFHGRTTTIITISTDELYREDFGPFTPGFEVIEYGDADALEAAIDENTVAFLVEPIQGEAGVRLPPEGYLRQVRELCDKHNVLLIFDEIQVGLGRTGKMFCWQHEDAKPDLITLGKALGGGCVPISACVGRRDILGLFRPGEHGSTFGGMPLSCAVSREALRVLIEEDLTEKARLQGEKLRRGLESIRCPQIKEVRGKGLLLALELEPGKWTARQVCEALQEEGILCKETHETTIRFAPPLIIEDAEIDMIIKATKKVLET
ncbi:MAG: ornithine--oxo-acid transaminase [Candidatus Lernaella stagnicola]|nr:ornithine--oxo-acid transaminase [Candidatus Lernaella stagnicola]